MAKTYEIPVAQTPKHASAAVSAANTALDGTGTIVTLLTAGADGAVISRLEFWGTVTSTAKRCNVFISQDGGTTWKLWDSGLMAAYTVANTTVQTPVKIIDSTLPDNARRIPASAVLGVTLMVAEASVAIAEYSDF
jgi:hypothetical protein